MLRRAIMAGYYLVLITLAACAALWTAPGSTAADSALQRDVRKMIGYHEAANGGSYSPKITDTRPLGNDSEAVRELWIVDRDGLTVEYEVTLTARPGGTAIGVKKVD